MNNDIIVIKKKNKNSKEGGFVELIIVILITLFTLKYLGLTISDVIAWFNNTFRNVLQ